MLGSHFSISDARRITKVDAQALCARDSQKFVRDNHKQVYYACATWMLTMSDLGVPEGLVLLVYDLIKTYGLKAVVGKCRAFADEVLEGMAGLQLTSDHRWEHYASTDRSIGMPIAMVLDFIESHVAQSEEESNAISLQILLYLERFTYIGETLHTDASMEKFFAVNLRCRDMEYDWSEWPGQSLIAMMRDALAEIYTKRFWSFDVARDCGFSNGSYVEAMRTNGSTGFQKSPLGKWVAFSRYRSSIADDPMYPLPGGCNQFRSYRRPVMTLVPKSFDTRRVIFPEDIVMSYYAHGALTSLRRMLANNGTSPFINEDNQAINRDFARIGSIDGEWATIDMSSASDSISKALGFACMPGWFHPIMLATSSNEFEVGVRGDRVKKLFTLYTSGNPMTWLFESTWFLALGRVAASLCGSPDPNLDVFVYGDDMVVRSDYYDTTVELLERFGHVVNRRKSYGSGLFRESCGGWYYNGTDITPTFWPRREVPDAPGTLVPVLVDLQHKFIRKGLLSSNEWIVAEILALYPEMTRSCVDSTYSDIWDPSVDEYSDDRLRHFYVEANLVDVPKVYRTLASHVAYYQYLMHGPSFDSELDQLLGISSSRLGRLLRYNDPDIVWFCTSASVR